MQVRCRSASGAVTLQSTCWQLWPGSHWVSISAAAVKNECKKNLNKALICPVILHTSAQPSPDLRQSQSEHNEHFFAQEYCVGKVVFLFEHSWVACVFWRIGDGILQSCGQKMQCIVKPQSFKFKQHIYIPGWVCCNPFNQSRRNEELHKVQFNHDC